MAPSDKKPGYSEDQAKAIIQRALERQTPAARVSHDELVATAQEIGISEVELQAAVAEEARERDERRDVDELNARRRRGLGAHLTSYLGVNALLLVINVLVGPPWWFVWPLVCWGFAVGMHWNAVRAEPSPRALARVRRRRRRQLRREELRRSIEHGAETFEAIVEGGVSALLSHLGERSRRIEGRKPGPDDGDPRR